MTSDREVASLLGMEEKAFNARKRREAFPETELYALSAKRPDLKLDVAYVLTGAGGRVDAHVRQLIAGMVRTQGLAGNAETAEAATAAIRQIAGEAPRRNEQADLLAQAVQVLDDDAADLLVKLALRLLRGGSGANAPPPQAKRDEIGVVIHGQVGQSIKGDVMGPQTFHVGNVVAPAPASPARKSRRGKNG
jgi:hypothetical protein